MYAGVDWAAAVGRAGALLKTAVFGIFIYKTTNALTKAIVLNLVNKGQKLFTR